MRPQTNGMVERFNGRIEDVLQSHRFQSGEDLEQTLLRYVHLYNSQLPQSVLRRSFDRASAKSPLHLVSAWACEERLFRGQIAVNGKSNEITALPNCWSCWL